MVFYLILASTGLLGFWLYYFVVLRRTTFFNLNRWYLFGALIFCLLVPLTRHFVDVKGSVGAENESALESYASEILITVDTLQNRIVSVQQTTTTKIPWLSTLYFIVCGFFLIRFIWSFVSVGRLAKGCEEVELAKFKVYRSPHIDQPFSLFNRVFIPKKWDSVPQEILYHELEHVEKRHFIDVIMLELVTILFWFNPIIYIYKKSVRLNLEYLADRAVLSRCVDPLKYQSLLISNALESSIKSPITTHFATPLKNRITMMKKQKTQNWMRIALLGAIPMAAGLVAMNTRAELRAPLEESITPIVAVIETDTRPSGFPLDKEELLKVTSEFGIRMHPLLKEEKLHSGIDLTAKKGTPVYATADGEVVISTNVKDRGNYIQIRHSEIYQTQYTHLQKMESQVGDQVKKGQVIGYVGNSGQSTGPHLHYEVHENGKPVDPRLFME
ncbi:peptidoglycan DD-metalloendopeptidase family protein [Fulvivirga sp. 29W222]|uniref:Peptidoglycan DD-metalloendopeptidase family protein n=1 Tax=Fulvivirga marina TaxID=2494733 RepID=A0A937FV11_9BACT|nr:M23/M56 family metallopeptidase [Fulvivirga marina]MBL6444726.1 peptidoglycan DD-metalloendopeptidase family protein [Fulvivirga marina]